jgi:hypothetical protein
MCSSMSRCAAACPVLLADYLATVDMVRKDSVNRTQVITCCRR